MTIKVAAAITLAVVSLTACQGYATRVSNQGSSAWIVRVSESGAHRFQTIAAGDTMAVDTIGEANIPAEDFVLYDADCVLVRRLPLLYKQWGEGGLIVVAADGSTTLQPGPLSATEQDGADVNAMRTTCSLP